MPGRRGTVVVRPHVNPPGAPLDQDYDPGPLTRREELRPAAEDRIHLVGQLGLHTSLIRAVAGARAGWAHAELWRVPPPAQTGAGGRGAP